MQKITLTPEEFLYHQTEEYALTLEQESAAWYEAYESEEQKIITLINSLLATHSPDSWDKLVNLFQTPEFHQIFADREHFAYMYILLNIYQHECFSGIPYTILEQGTHLDQFHSLMQEIKLLFWRIEFFDTEHSTQSDYGNVNEQERALFHFIEEHKLSPVALYYLITTICIAPPKMILYLASKYLEQNKLFHTMILLEQYNENYPENEDVLCILSELRRINER